MKLQNGTSKTNGFEMSSRPLKIAINIILIIIVIIALSIFLNNLTKNKSDKEIKEYHFNKINTETIISYNFYGMPHIYASNENDMFFAIGWAQAESRLWQMDFLRRAAYGRLSEIIGDDALSLDKFLRSLEIKKISDSSYNIYDLIKEQKQKGVGILYIGEDLDVLLELCDRIMVLCDGKITGITDSSCITKEGLGLLMAGENLSALTEEETACK